MKPYTKSSQRVDLAKLLKTRTLRKVDAIAPAPRTPTHDDGSPLTEEICDRLHHEKVVASVGQALRAPGAPLMPNWGRK
jgi:hypothetical protein